jgi:hypothetical protein
LQLFTRTQRNFITLSSWSSTATATVTTWGTATITALAATSIATGAWSTTPVTTSTWGTAPVATPVITTAATPIATFTVATRTTTVTPVGRAGTAFASLRLRHHSRGRQVALTINFAFENPHLDADFTVNGLCFRQGIVNVCP